MTYLNLIPSQIINFLNSSSIRSFFISILPPFNNDIIPKALYIVKGIRYIFRQKKTRISGSFAYCALFRFCLSICEYFDAWSAAAGFRNGCALVREVPSST